MENQLTLADLVSIKSIIEAASNRGAFKAEELSQVGAVYDKLSLFLKSTQPQVSAPADSVSTQAQGDQNA